MRHPVLSTKTQAVQFPNLCASLLVVKLVEATAGLLSQALVVIEQGDDLGGVHPLWEGLDEVLAHMKPNVSTHQVTQPVVITRSLDNPQ